MAELTPQARPLLDVAGVSYRYGMTTVLHDISFTIDRGQIVALIGRNGAGKTTLLRCAAGWTRTYGGEVRVDGLAVYRVERRAREKLAFVPDTPIFYDELTAWEHMQLMARLNRIPDWEARAEGLLREVVLWEQRGALPFTYSRGMRYKLALALALLVRPPLLLLDEPFGPLDPEAATNLWVQLAALRDEGQTVLLSSHSLPPRARPDRFLVMEQGRLIADGTPEELGIAPEGFTLESLLASALGAAEAARITAEETGESVVEVAGETGDED
jgi:ABC-2 type transport system ATP-binding protein